MKLPLWKVHGSSFRKAWKPFTYENFEPSLVKIGLVSLEKKIKMWKVYDDNDKETTGIFWLENPTWAFGLGELKIFFEIAYKYILLRKKTAWYEKGTQAPSEYLTKSWTQIYSTRCSRSGHSIYRILEGKLYIPGKSR